MQATKRNRKPQLTAVCPICTRKAELVDTGTHVVASPCGCAVGESDDEA